MGGRRGREEGKGGKEGEEGKGEEGGGEKCKQETTEGDRIT